MPVKLCEEIAVGKRAILNTGKSLISVAEDGKKSILPAAYRWRINFFQLALGYIWVGDAERGMLALNTRDFSVVKSLPNVKYQCIAVEPGGFWCILQDDNMPVSIKNLQFNDNYYKEFFTRKLIEYDSTGIERRRLLADGKQLPEGEIQLAGIDAKAIWIANNSRGLYHQSPFYPYLQLYRIGREEDDVLSPFVYITNLPMQSLINLSDRIIGYRVNEGITEIFQFNKKDYICSYIGSIKLPDTVREVVADDHYLWFKTLNPKRLIEDNWFTFQVFSLASRKEVSQKDAGTPPPLIQGLRYSIAQKSQFSPINGFGSYLWCQGKLSSHTLFALNDDGTTFAHKLIPYRLGEYFLQSYVQSDGIIYKKLHGDFLVRLQPDKSSAKMVQAAHISPLSRSGGSSRLWFYISGGFVTIDANLKEQHWIPSGIIQQVEQRKTATIGAGLYGLGLNNPDKLNKPIHDIYTPIYVDAEKQQVKFLSSWRAQMMPDIDWRSHSYDSIVTFPLPDGRVVYQSGEGNAVCMMNSFIYNPVTDQWITGKMDDWFRPFPTGSTLYGLNGSGDVAIWQGDGWVRVGKAPQGINADSLSQAATDKYLYVRTDLGLCRMAWKDMIAGN